MGVAHASFGREAAEPAAPLHGVTAIALAENVWIDPVAQERLTAGVFGSAVIARRFFADFISSWERRMRRLVSALDAADAEDVYVALLSIRSTSEMVGAVPLSRLARKLENLARGGQLDACRAELGELRRVGALTIQALARTV